jgi:hypothetical protein
MIINSPLSTFKDVSTTLGAVTLEPGTILAINATGDGFEK